MFDLVGSGKIYGCKEIDHGRPKYVRMKNRARIADAYPSVHC